MTEKTTKVPKKEAKPKGKNGGARPGAGRPMFVPTQQERDQVETMSGFGVPFDQIAALVRNGIDLDTLRKHFSAELINGKAKANQKIGRSIYNKAMDGDTTAMIWWSKTQMRWSEVQKHEVTGADGAPLGLAVEFIKP